MPLLPQRLLFYAPVLAELSVSNSNRIKIGLAFIVLCVNSVQLVVLYPTLFCFILDSPIDDGGSPILNYILRMGRPNGGDGK